SRTCWNSPDPNSCTAGILRKKGCSRESPHAVRRLSPQGHTKPARSTGQEAIPQALNTISPGKARATTGVSDPVGRHCARTPRKGSPMRLALVFTILLFSRCLLALCHAQDRRLEARARGSKESNETTFPPGVEYHLDQTY